MATWIPAFAHSELSAIAISDGYHVEEGARIKEGKAELGLSWDSGATFGRSGSCSLTDVGTVGDYLPSVRTEQLHRPAN